MADPIPIVLQHYLCPGDTTVMTVIPRELHRHYPGKFAVSVRTAHPDIWSGNPFIEHSFLKGDRVPPHYKVVKLGYNPREERGGDRHFMHSYLDDAAKQLSGYGVTQLYLTEFRPCIRMTKKERERGPSAKGVFQGRPYWLVMPGGKEDISTKWWDPKKWQAVIYALSNDKNFPEVAQVGKSVRGARNPSMKGCISLVDQTTLRELIWLTYHSRGVICGQSCLMHIAAALRKPCVVIAGGREAWWWDSYDDRAFERHKDSIPEGYHKLFPLRPPQVCLDTIGQLPCCRENGCWKTGIGEKQPEKNCVDVVKPEKYSPKQSIPQPRCMTLIRPRDVLKAVVRFEEGWK